MLTIKIAPIVGICLLVLSNNVDAYERNRVEMKCYVELLNGDNVIHYATIPEKKIAKLAKSLLNNKISIVQSKQKQIINEVIECVESNTDFKNMFARELQKNSVH